MTGWGGFGWGGELQGTPNLAVLGRFRDPSWRLDGKSLKAFDWQATADDRGGDRDANVKCAASALPNTADQGSELVLEDSDGSYIWGGELVTRPYIHGGEAELVADGPVAQLERRADKLLYMTRDTSVFTPAENDPHNYNEAGSKHFNVDEKKGALRYFIEEANLDLGDIAGLVAWYPGSELSRLQYDWTINAVLNNLQLRTASAVGPSGSLTVEGDQGLGGATSGSVSQNIDDGMDLVRLALRVDAGDVDPTTRRKVIAKNLRLWGRTTNEDYSATDVLADVAGLVGWNTDGITPSPLAVLPLDWTDDQPRALMDYMADLLDWWWGISGKVSGAWAVSAADYTDEWTVYEARNAALSQPPLHRFNRVVVPFEYVSGAPGTFEATPDDDPFPGQNYPFYAEDISDPQQTDQLAEAVATRLAPYYASERVQGNVDIISATSGGREQSPYRVRPGTLLNIPDHQPSIGAQRVVAVTYKPAKQVTLELNDEVNITSLLTQEFKGKKKKRRRRRKGKGRGK